MEIEKIELNKNITIHRAKYDWKHPKESLIGKVKQNLSYVGLSDLTTSPLLLQSKEINHLKDYTRNIALKILGITQPKNWIEKHWIYASDRRTDLIHGTAPIFHNHRIAVDNFNTSPILTTISYCTYLNVPFDLKSDEGRLEFKDKDGEIVSILPRTGEILFFSPIYLHKPNFIKNSKAERIAICSNLTVDLKELSTTNALL